MPPQFPVPVTPGHTDLTCRDQETALNWSLVKNNGPPLWSFKQLQNTPHQRYQWIIREPKCTLRNCRYNCSQLIHGYTRDSLPFPYSGAFPNKGRNFIHFFPSANYSKKPQPSVLLLTTEGRTECFPPRLKGFSGNFSLWLGNAFFWRPRQAQQPSGPRAFPFPPCS